MILLALAAVAVIPSGQSFACTPVVVNDGDTFRCSTGVKVRLRAIDAPEMPGHCRRGRNCAAGDPFASKRELTHRVAGRTLQCVADGRTHDRTAAWCSAAGVDLSCAQFRGGYAIREAKWDRRNQLCR